MRYDCYEMARKKCYETAAEKQKAYRERKKKATSDWEKATVIAHHQKPTIDALRDLIKVEEEKPRVEAPVIVGKPIVRRTETGMVISEEQWQAREEYKRQAKEKGFVPDEYSQ